jgi:hypothetical protein
MKFMHTYYLSKPTHGSWVTKMVVATQCLCHGTGLETLCPPWIVVDLSQMRGQQQSINGITLLSGGTVVVGLVLGSMVTLVLELQIDIKEVHD